MCCQQWLWHTGWGGDSIPYRQLQTLCAYVHAYVCVPTTAVITCCLHTVCVNVLQAGGPAGRRGHCLVGVQGRFLLLHGGYSGSCELLQDAWLYDTHRDVWLPVELTGMGRAQHKSVRAGFDKGMSGTASHFSL